MAFSPRISWWRKNGTNSHKIVRFYYYIDNISANIFFNMKTKKEILFE